MEPFKRVKMRMATKSLERGRTYERTNFKRGHAYERTKKPWGGMYLQMNEHVFVDTKHQSLECSFISIEDWNYLLRHDLLKCFSYGRNFSCLTRFCPVTGCSSYGSTFRNFSYDKNDGNFSSDGRHSAQILKISQLWGGPFISQLCPWRSFWPPSESDPMHG